ncbi:uncharacterized protein [Palaemon carinicauda]|uniref:uncharacterized protein n=1 Tax=Palaemon carinicauda TaxID=392227 RepID=UPI0035B61E32
MNVLSEEIRNEELCEFLYTEDLRIITGNEEDLQRRVVDGQETLESGFLRVNMDKTETKVSIRECGDRIAIHKSRGSFIKLVKQPRYLVSTISQEERCKAEVENRIKPTHGKWREIAGVVCDKKMPMKLKVKIYSKSS